MHCDATGMGEPPTAPQNPCIHGLFRGFATQSGGTERCPCDTNLFVCYVYLDR